VRSDGSRWRPPARIGGSARWSTTGTWTGLTLESTRLNEEKGVVVAIEQMLALGNGGLLVAFVVLVIVLTAYAIYYLVFKMGK
jgi:hypothetical protein